MTLEQDKVNSALQPLIDRILPLYHAKQIDRSSPHFWAARAVETFCKNGDLDRGIFSIYFFNLLHLQKGEGIYQPAGLPHAYLEGQNVEIMANSDNVLRAGLTDKHIDIAELMKHVRFVATHPEIIKAGNEQYQTFKPPVTEFELHRHQVRGEQVISTASVEIWILLNGEVKVTDEKIIKGEALFVLPNKGIVVQSEEPATLFRAAVPADGKN
jgi:mannose-6-phosphate isomerase